PALVEREVHARDRLTRRIARGRLRRENPLHHRAQERRRRSFAGHVAEGKTEASRGQIDVIIEVAADRTARQRRRRETEERAVAAALREKRLLDLGGDAHLLLHLRLLHRLAIEPRVLDRDRRLGGQRFERALRGAGKEAALLAAVEIEHADAFLFGRRRF